LVAYLNYDGSQGDSIFVEVTCDKSAYIEETVRTGETVAFRTRANLGSCEEVTFSVYSSNPDTGGSALSSTAVSTQCPDGPWTLGAKIAEVFTLDAFIDTEDDGVTPRIYVGEVEVELNFIAENAGQFPLTVVSGEISDVVAGADSGVGGVSQVGGLPLNLPTRSRATLESINEKIDLQGRNGDIITYTFSLSGQTDNEFALPCEDETSLTFTL